MLAGLATMGRGVCRAAVLFCILGLWHTWTSADQIWEFVDRDGVVHMGNAAPPAGRGVVWLDKTPSVKPSTGKGAGGRGPQLSALEAVKPHLEAAALSESLEPALVFAVAAAESAFNVDAVSRKGALGLMQVMPATAERYGVANKLSPGGKHAVMEPKLNAQVGSRYLADLLRMFQGDKELALAAYNAGEGAVMKYGKQIPPFPETQRYVEKVMRFYQAWR